MKKNVAKIVMLVGLTGILGFHGMESVQVKAAGYYSETNAPEFYGLTKAVIQTGDDFAADDTPYRIFARDFEDGDVTGSIEMISNTVDPSKAGEYKIEYRVTDSDGNHSELTVPITVKDDCENRYFERTLYSLPSVANMELAGTNRGNGHDRQMLGFYMEQGSSIQVRIVSGTDKLDLNYWNNDSNTELSKTITSEDTTVTSTEAGGVPFIKTVYGVEEPVVVGITVGDNENTGKVTELPYYHYKDNEEEFFSEWEANKDSYAVIESEDVTVLVPYADRNYLVNYYEKCHTSLDDFLFFWHKTMKEYDEFLGLSYDAEDGIDQNVKTKYFFKANAHGVGAAYYSGSHVGVNKSSVASIFEVNWGGLHEVGHGYQGSLAHSGMELGEVSNNILGHYVQINKDIYMYNDDWLGSIINIEQNINNKRLSGTSFSELAVNEQLYFLVNLLDTYEPKKTYAQINQLWRRTLRDKQNISSQEAYVLAMYHLYDVNAAPYFEAWGLSISDSVKEKVSGSRNLFSLADIVNDSEQAEAIRQDLSKEGIYSLVSGEELKKYNMTGDLNLSMVIDDIDNIVGKKIVIQNGEEYRKEVTITGKDMLIEDVTAGTYEVKLPVPKQNIYEYEPITYAIVKNGTSNQVRLIYENSTEIQLLSDTVLHLHGLGDVNFASITFADNNTMNVISNATSPHVYFTDEYAEIKVYNLQNELVYSKTYIGNENSKAANDKISIEAGYKIEIMHREAASRLVPYSNTLGKTDLSLVPTEKNTNYIVGEYGLYKEAAEDESYVNYKAKLDEYIQIISDEMSEEDLYHKNIGTVSKKNLLVRILKLKEPEKTEYLEKYRHIYNGSSPVLSQNEVTVMQYKEFDLYELLYATDIEDGKIILTRDNAVFYDVPGNTNPIKDYQVAYEITDSDGNVTKGNITLHLVENPSGDDISKLDITRSQVTLSSTVYSYTGTARKPSVTVKMDDKILQLNIDYTVSYKNNKAIGKATVTITGKGNYKGSINKTFTIKPQRVTSLKQKTPYSTSTITMRWKKVSGATGYVVYRASSKQGKYTKIATTTSTSDKNRKLKTGTKYYYKVRAYTTVNGTRIYGSFSAITVMSTKPQAPAVKVTAGSKMAKVTWKKVTGASGYEVNMSTSSKGKYTKIKTVSSKTTSYNKTRLTENKTYYFKVRAYKNVNGKKVYSDWSSVKSVYLE